MPSTARGSATRRRILDAATEEFAAHGIAGARVDRIAAAAGANKALIYFHFSNKDGLFTAVFEQIVNQALAEAPMDGANLPEYAGRLFDISQAHPEVLRLVTWHRLERAATDPPMKAVLAANQSKIDAIAKAQEAGRVTTRFTAPDLLALALTIANMWTVQSPEPHPSAPRSPEAQRAVIVAAVTALVKP